METYHLDNCASWLHVAKSRGRPVELHDLVFIQQCTLTGDWATAVWHESSCNSNIGFKISAGVADLSLSFWGQWEDRVTIPTRLGPKRTEENRMAYSTGNFDQCIFFKGIRAVLREWYEKLTLSVWTKAAEGQDGQDIQGSNQPAYPYSLKKSDLKIENVGEKRSLLRPVRWFALPDSHAKIYCPAPQLKNVYEAMAMYIFEVCPTLIAYFVYISQFRYLELGSRYRNHR